MNAKINNIEVIVKNGNIATEPVELIVVPEFCECASYGGVGGALAYFGMERGLEAYDGAVEKKGLSYGDALITESGKEGVKLAHVVTVGADENIQFQVVFKAVFKALAEAEKQGIKSIAFPEIGSGIIGNLTQEQSAKAIFCAVYEFGCMHNVPSVKTVELVVYRGVTDYAEKVLSEKSYTEFRNEKGNKDFNMAEWLCGMGFL